MDSKEVLKFSSDNDIKFVDLKFVDFIGTWQHFTVPVSELEESSFEDGFGFDGSSIRGWQAINESDMLILPDPGTCFLDTFHAIPTISLTATILDPMITAKIVAPRIAISAAFFMLRSVRFGLRFTVTKE